MKGIDISMHNKDINFDLVRKDGVEVVIIKATEGINYIDPKFVDYYNAAKGKFNIGFYHFFSEKTDPKQQAVDFYNAIKDKSYQVTPVLDIETNKEERSKTEVTNRCIEFLNKFKEISGIDCIIYTGGFFGKDYLDDRVKLYPAWIAHYGVDKPMYNGFTNVVGHQFTETGRVLGIYTDCDVNRFNENIFLNKNNIVVKPSNTLVKDTRVLELQRIVGVSDDNIWGPITDAAVRPLLAYKGNDNNPELVKWLQARLGCEPDGIFGPVTESALIGWQSKHSLKVDGIAGYNSIKSLALE